jgi:hypothetical protein
MSAPIQPKGLEEIDPVETRAPPTFLPALPIATEVDNDGDYLPVKPPPIPPLTRVAGHAHVERAAGPPSDNRSPLERNSAYRAYMPRLSRDQRTPLSGIDGVVDYDDDVDDLLQASSESQLLLTTSTRHQNSVEATESATDRETNPFAKDYSSEILFPDTLRYKASERDVLWTWLSYLSVAKLRKSGVLSAFKIPQSRNKQTLMCLVLLRASDACSAWSLYQDLLTQST